MAEWKFNTAAIQALVEHSKVQEDLDARADAAVDAAIVACPVNWARLVSTIRSERRGPGRRVSYGNDTDAYYAPYVEWGTRPHDIVAKTARGLWWPGLSHPVHKVHHPGTPAFHVMGGAALDAARRST